MATRVTQDPTAFEALLFPSCGNHRDERDFWMFFLRFHMIVLNVCAYIGQYCRISPLCRNKSKASVKSGEGKRREERQSWVLLWVYCSVFKPTEARRTFKKSDLCFGANPPSSSVLELPRPRGGGEGEIKYVSKGEETWRKEMFIQK